MVEFDETLPYKRRVIHFTKEFVLPFSSDKFNLFNVFDNRCLGVNNRIPAEIAESENNKILKIIEYINTNLTSELTIDILSKKFYISKYYISRLFKATTGYSINQYISYKRIWLADELISGGMSATDACHHVGYNDYSNFYKAFTKIIGFSPKLSK